MLEKKNLTSHYWLRKQRVQVSVGPVLADIIQVSVEVHHPRPLRPSLQQRPHQGEGALGHLHAVKIKYIHLFLRFIKNDRIS